VFIAIALDKLWDNEEYARRLTELKQQLKMIDPSVHIPSEKRLERRQGYVENGISLPADLWQEILDLNVNIAFYLMMYWPTNPQANAWF